MDSTGRRADSEKTDRIFDVTGLGSVSLDFLGTIGGAWPEAGSKTALSGFSLHGGGLAGTALVAVARLGGRARLAGKLGDSELARRTLAGFHAEGVDTSLVVPTPGAEPILSFVLSSVTDGQRTVFFTRQGVQYPGPEEFPDRDWVHRTKTLFLSAGTERAGLDAAACARTHGVPVVLDMENVGPLSEAFIRAVDYLVVPESFACGYTGLNCPEKMVRALQDSKEQVVVITLGADGCVGIDRDEVFRLPAFLVDVVDTTGCGDVFHGAFSLAVARGEGVIDACRFASAAAALCATKLGGREGIPGSEEVRQLLSRGFISREEHSGARI